MRGRASQAHGSASDTIYIEKKSKRPFCAVHAQKGRLLPRFFVTLSLRDELTLHSEEKTNEFVLFFSRFLVTLQRNCDNYGIKTGYL